MDTRDGTKETLEERIQRGIADGTIKELKMTQQDGEGVQVAQERANIAKQLMEFKPTINWWTRSTLRRLIRIVIGLHEDVAKGELFEKLVMSNVLQQAQLLQGLRQDFDAINRTQNPVNSKDVDIEERLTFYEKNNDALQGTYRKLIRLRTEEQIKREREADKAAREAVKTELQSHASPGELIDCRDCHGAGEFIDKNSRRICPMCNGLGVEPNPEYIPPTEEINGDSRQEGGIEAPGSRHLQLES